MQVTLLRFVNMSKAEQRSWLNSPYHRDHCEARKRGEKCCLEKFAEIRHEPEIVDVQIDPDGPITQRKRAELVRTICLKDNDVERTAWEEYRLASAPDAEHPVHRSVDVILKKADVSGAGAAASVG
jgi:hypothetical protein